MLDAAGMKELVEAERQRFDVPGAAVVVVADGETVLADGFGVRELGTRDPVTSQTLFPLASDTKCFTAAMLCLLADEGRLDLDAPIRDYITWFRLSDPMASELVSCRDLLSHRTGLPGHDMVWYGETPRSLEDIVRSLRHLQLSKQLRQTWQYSNLCYSTAGYLTEVLTGLEWEQAVQTKLLDPLQMKATGFSAHDASTGDFAWPYHEVDGELTLQVLPSPALQKPAGGLVSNVEDLANWLAARLGRDVNGERVLSDAALTQLHTPAMVGAATEPMPERDSLGYALGCQVYSHRGHKLIGHGGNLIGYSSNIAVAPALGVGVAVLTNRHYCELPNALVALLLDEVAGLERRDWGARYHKLERARIGGLREVKAQRAARAAGRPPSRPASEFAGIYRHPAYGEISLSVSSEEGRLLDVDLHGLGDRIGIVHRDRDAFDLELREFERQAPITFTTDDQDEIAGLTVGLEPAVEPIAFIKDPPPMDEALLTTAPGIYSNGPIEITVTVRDGGLVVTAPSVGTVRLAPRGGAVFGVPDMPGVRVEFAVDQIVVDPLGVFPRCT
jgi:CubicO group peptidase (beta-lactamase class C family)